MILHKQDSTKRNSLRKAATFSNVKKSRFAPRQIIVNPKIFDGGRLVVSACLDHEINEPTLFNWRRKYASMKGEQFKQLNEAGDHLFNQIHTKLALDYGPRHFPLDQLSRTADIVTKNWHNNDNSAIQYKGKRQWNLQTPKGTYVKLPKECSPPVTGVLPLCGGWLQAAVILGVPLLL